MEELNDLLYQRKKIWQHQHAEEYNYKILCKAIKLIHRKNVKLQKEADTNNENACQR